MEQTQEKTNKKAGKIYCLLGMIIALIVGLIIGNFFKIAPQSKPQPLTEEQIIERLKEKFSGKMEKGLIPFLPVPNPLEATSTSLSGKIINVDFENKSLKVEIANVFRGGDLFAFLDEPDYFVKTVIITEETKILKQEPKTPQEIEKEQGEFKEKMKKGLLALPPSPFYEIEASLENLKEDQMISIKSKEPFQLKDNQPIKAVEIRF